MRNYDDSHRQLTAGLILMTMGFVFLMDRMGYFSFHDAVRLYWPLILIAMGVSRLLRRAR